MFKGLGSYITREGVKDWVIFEGVDIFSSFRSEGYRNFR